MAIRSEKCGPLQGDITVPGDKSISHRALMIGALAVGETQIHGLLEGEDVHATARALRQLGVEIEKESNGDQNLWRVNGRGVGGLCQPSEVINLGNSGTSARLLMGILAGHPFPVTLTGDASLSDRPMARAMAPLRRMGASFSDRSGGRLPVTVTGAEHPLPIIETLKVASAQVKSAILLAGMSAPGKTTVIEPSPSRDHTENMLAQFGVEIESRLKDDGAKEITLTGQTEITGREVRVPGDISSAAYPLVAVLLTPGSEIVIRNLGVNPLRAGLVDTLIEMGASIGLDDQREQAGEKVADLTACASELRGVNVPAHRAPSMIDEYPVLAVAAACAEGTTTFEGVGELRVKESDRLSAIALGLSDCGIDVEETKDSLTIHGVGGAPQGITPPGISPPGISPQGGATIASHLDHRMAMAFLVMGMASEQPITVDDGGPIETSFPGFARLMNGLGADIKETSE